LGLFLELCITALAAALPVGMAGQEHAVAAPGTDRLLGLDGVAGYLIKSGGSYNCTLLGTFLAAI